MATAYLVVVHGPGPAWQKGLPPFEQAGLQAHFLHYHKLLQDGELLLGGPFKDEQSGGMMVVKPGMSEEELKAYAAADPTIQSGLLVYEIRPWLAALSSITDAADEETAGSPSRHRFNSPIDTS